MTTLTSPDGRYFAQLQNDGNLVVYDYTGRAVSWMGVDEHPPGPLPEPEHVDPTVFTLAQLARFRGAMWTARSDVRYGPRPYQPTNILAMDYYQHYDAIERGQLLHDYLLRGYTHAVTGPIIDPDGYHGQYPAYPGPLTQSWWDAYLDALQEWWDARIMPVHFAIPDFPGWTVQRAIDELTPFFTQERAQRLLRIVVTAWEPSGWTSADFRLATSWLARIFPHALRCVHLWSDHNAPAQSSEIVPGVFEEAQMWAVVAPYIHVFLQQTAESYDGTDEQRAYQLAMWNPSMQGSWASRFERGYAGWPTHSAWGDRGILAIPSEYYSYPCYWQDTPEATAQAWGDACVRMGARGYLDGGTVEVPA